MRKGENIVPVYDESDYKTILSEIKSKVNSLSLSLNPPLVMESIISFERNHNITLPMSYKLFLTEIGDGIPQMLDDMPINKLNDIPIHNLDRPFPLTEAFIWEDEDVHDDIVNDILTSGNLELINTGCSMSYNLIVTGDCRAEVWCFSDVGVQPCSERQDFLGWFSLWLDENENVDYFKEYI